ncbi:MAG: hypothetical protein LUI12_01915 [Clostridiales bacterium]|nr:hypothetical protein [Clostridiales bacterium]
MSMVCDGRECEYAEYCGNCYETSSLEEYNAGKRTFTQFVFGGTNGCQDIVKRDIERQKTTKLLEQITPTMFKNLPYEQQFFLEYIAKNKPDITQWDFREHYNEIREEWEESK